MHNLLRATDFAAQAHRNQRRKNKNKDPYINHPILVARYISEYCPSAPLEVFQAALLHDTVEDTNTTFEDIEREFGCTVRNLVAEVTDDKTLPKAERRRLQIEHASKVSMGAKMIKIADKMANVHDLGTSPPENWTQEYMDEYIKFARDVVEAAFQEENGALCEAFHKIVKSLNFSAEMTPETDEQSWDPYVKEDEKYTIDPVTGVRSIPTYTSTMMFPITHSSSKTMAHFPEAMASRWYAHIAAQSHPPDGKATVSETTLCRLVAAGDPPKEYDEVPDPVTGVRVETQGSAGKWAPEDVIAQYVTKMKFPLIACSSARTVPEAIASRMKPVTDELDELDAIASRLTKLPKEGGCIFKYDEVPDTAEEVADNTPKEEAD